MRSRTMGLVQLVLSILVIAVFHFFYWKMLSIFGLHFSGMAYSIANLLKYVLVALLIFVIYHKNIHAGKRKFNRTLLTSLLYCVVCFVILIVVTIALHKLLNILTIPRGFEMKYGFVDYFHGKFTINYALKLIIDCILIPFLLCVIFPLGFSNVIKHSSSASLAAGLSYGIVYAIGLNTNLEYAIFHAITPAIIVMILTILYKMNKNIWSVIVTYICFVVFGSLAIGFIV